MRFLLTTLLMVTTAFCVQAQTGKPIHWSFSLSKNEVKQGDFVEIIMKAEINPDWYLYSSDFDRDLGPTVTSVAFETNPGFQLAGELKPVGAKEKYDSLWEGKVRYFVKHAEFRQKIKILSVNPVVKGVLQYQVCSDKEGKCIPYEEELFFDKLKVTAAITTPEKGTTESPSEKKKTEITKIVPEEKKTPATGNKLSDLELEKSKLVQKDIQGNDIAVEQLKGFVQKYGGEK